HGPVCETGGLAFAYRDLWNIDGDPPSHSSLTFAALMIGAQRAISLFTRAASGGWPRRALSGTSQPISASRLRTFSAWRALSRASVSRSRIGCVVPLGANKAHQGMAWNSGSPASFAVGTFGRAGLRCALPIA